MYNVRCGARDLQLLVYLLLSTDKLEYGLQRPSIYVDAHATSTL